jgi:transcriptional regulator with XRE-family HTH domain
MSMRFTEIGQQLRAYRLESGLRAEEIAARLGVSRAALYRYEKGEVIKLDTIKRLAELLKISPLSLLGIGVEYYNRPIGYFERIRQVEETAEQILQLFGPVCYLTTSDAYDAVLGEAFDEAADQAGPERVAMRSTAEQALNILAARKRMYAMRRPGIIAMLSVGEVRRFLGKWHCLRGRDFRSREADLPRRGGLRGGEHRQPDGNRADGVAIRLAGRGRANVLIQNPACPGPRQSRRQPIPSGLASERAYRGRDDHRRRRGDRGASACRGGQLARGDQRSRRGRRGCGNCSPR